MQKKLYEVKLSDKQRLYLLKLISTGKHSARELNRARILLLADEGEGDQEIADILNIGRNTVQRTRRRFVEGGLESALKEKPRSGKPPKLDSKDEAILTMIACSKAPEGHTRWTLRLLSDKLVELEVVDSISRECVRRTLKKRT